jgi:Helix-turn-helix domain
MKAHKAELTGSEMCSDQTRPYFATLDEMAVILKVSIRTIQNMMAGGLPYYEPVPGRRLFCLEEIFEWLRHHKRRVRGTLSGYTPRKARSSDVANSKVPHE